MKNKPLRPRLGQTEGIMRLTRYTGKIFLQWEIFREPSPDVLPGDPKEEEEHDPPIRSPP